jgi:ornithine decarboxylase
MMESAFSANTRFDTAAPLSLDINFGGHFVDAADVVARTAPVTPVFCIDRAIIQRETERFLAGFPGKVLYAVKCNPQPIIVGAVAAAGVSRFDAASLPEIEAVRRQVPNAEIYFHHPVKSREAIADAYHQFGVRHFTVDHVDELAKVAAVAGPDCEIAVRMATPSGFATFDLSTKFGATPEQAAVLLQRVAACGFRPGISFHVGSQCASAEAYRVALVMVSDVLKKSGVKISSLNVGGGFPAAYPNVVVPPLEVFFDEIKSGVDRLELAPDVAVLCEPGRALVANGVSLVVRVELRKEKVLYINDGVLGSLSETVHGKAVFSVALLRA